MTTTRSRGMGSAAAQALRRPSPTPAEGAQAHSLVAALSVDLNGSALQTIRVSEIAEHPDNPRTSLGALEELADSIKVLGLRQPIVVVPVIAFNAANPGVPLESGAQWVVLAGHRRRAAALLAGVEQIPAWVRPDLAGRADASETFIAENVHRIGLAPLEEASVYALLTDLGRSQRDIAQRSGVSQAHVSKRMSLLRLPQPIQDAVASDSLAIGDALAIAAAREEIQLPAFELARARRCPVPTAIHEVERRLAVAAAVDQARDRAMAEGLQFVEPIERTTGSVSWRRLVDATEIDAARVSGGLAGGCEPSGPFVYLEAVQEYANGERLDHREQARRAAESRRLAAQQLVSTRPPARVVSQSLTDAVLFDRFDYTGALKLTQQWIGDSVGITDRDPQRWRDSLKGQDAATRAWVAWALTIAASEIRAECSSSWGERERGYLQLLHDKVGYTPTQWEEQCLATDTAVPGDSDDLDQQAEAS